MDTLSHTTVITMTIEQNLDDFIYVVILGNF
jgi:hypothetical protein